METDHIEPPPEVAEFVGLQREGRSDPSWEPGESQAMDVQLAREEYQRWLWKKEQEAMPSTSRVQVTEVIAQRAKDGIEESEQVDGVAYLAREKFADPTVDFLEIQRTRDQQIEPADTSDEANVIRANAQKACAACPGHCCRAFVLTWWPNSEQELEDRLDMYRNRLLPDPVSMAVRPEDARRADLDRAHALLREKHGDDRAWSKEALHTYEFFKRNLVVINEARKTYSCAAFDPVARRCTAYAERPLLCRKFVCGPAMFGEIPRMNYMEAENIPSVRAQWDPMYEPDIKAQS